MVGNRYVLSSAAAMSVLAMSAPLLAPAHVGQDAPWQRSRNRTWVPKPISRIKAKRKAAQRAQRLARRKNRQ